MSIEGRRIAKLRELIKKWRAADDGLDYCGCDQRPECADELDALLNVDGRDLYLPHEDEP